MGLQEVLDGFRSWGTGWKDRALAAEAQNVTLTEGLTAAQSALADKAQELADVLANDATDDAIQIDQAKADQAQADADAAQAALDGAQAADLPPAPPVDPPVVEPPVVEDPPVEPPVDPNV